MKNVKIYSVHYNRPDFIKLQYDSFRHHLKESFEFIVVNNAKQEAFRNQIRDAANNENLKCIDTYSKAPDHLPGRHHSESLDIVWQSHVVHDKNNYAMILDGDVFLIKSFCIEDFMQDNILAGPKQQREFKYHYLTPAVMILDMSKLPDAETISWEGISIEGTGLDTGGALHLYYESHPEIKTKTKELKSSWHIKAENKNKFCLPDELLSSYNDEYHLEFFGNEFLHYCRSSNWNYQSEEHHKLKTEFVKNFVYGTINGTIQAKEHNYQTENRIYLGWGP